MAAEKYPELLIKHAGGVVVKHLSISIVDQILEGGGGVDTMFEFKILRRENQIQIQGDIKAPISP